MSLLLHGCSKEYIALTLLQLCSTAMTRQKSVRVDAKLIESLRRLVREKRDALGLKRYRSLAQAAEDAIRQFLLNEMPAKQSQEAPAA